MQLYEYATLIGTGGFVVMVVATIVNINIALDVLRKAALAYVTYTEASYCDCDNVKEEER